jgi:predicted nucleotide-binding protein (sugar kinase/HSP70/actin superfamily)
MIKELKRKYPIANIVAIDYDPGASEVNQLNRIKLMLAQAGRSLELNNAYENKLEKSVKAKKAARKPINI